MEVLQRLHNRGSISTGEYQIDNSVKMEQDNTERMYRPWGSGSGDRRTWTISCWVKRTELGDLQYMWGAGTGGLDFLGLSFDADDTLRFRHYTSAEYCIKKTNRLFRDISAWYHIVVAVDTTDGTAGNRQKIYINGIEETSFQTSTDFDQNRETPHNQASGYFEVGTMIGSADRFNGYISELYSISGLQLAPTDFGKFDDNGVWIPIDYAGSYPGNSVRLEFKNASSMGDDTGGNHDSQPLTLQNIDASDQATDTPTNNFCTFNAVNMYGNTATLKEGATFTASTANGAFTTYGTMAPSSGKWWWEGKIQVFADTAYACIGATTNLAGLPSVSAQLSGGHVIKLSKAQKWVLNDTGYGYGAAYADGDIINVGLDLDNRKFYSYKNGTIDDANGIDISSTTFDGFGSQWMPLVITYGSGGASSYEINFGGYRTYGIGSPQSDANGYGTFEYAPPSGYYALCTKNLAEYG